jgi:glycosyltransferase involved in cell wall biosynthesis
MTLTQRVRNRMARWASVLRGSLYSLSANLDPRPAVIHIVEGTGWVIDQVGYNIAARVKDRYFFRVVTDYRGYRNCILHFGSPPLYVNRKVHEQVHASNRLLLTWTHGLPGDPDPATQMRVKSIAAEAQHIDRFKVQTTTAQGFLISQGIEPDRIVHIPLGVDTKVFCPPTTSEKQFARARLGIPEDAFCIGSFQKDSPGWDNSNLDMKWVKGPDVFADVVEQLAEHYPVYVLLTSPARGYLISRLERAGISYRHDVLDKPEELVRYYHALDLYLITSRDEGGPMSMLEAMASYLPVVSTRMGIPKDAIKHGHNGMLAEIDDVDGLAASVEQLIRDSDLRNQVAENARKTILAYDWSVIADKYARLLYNFES